MRKDDQVRLQHMLDAAREAIGFAQGRARTDLDSDRILEILWRTVQDDLPPLITVLERVFGG
jgi:uncharacterized protein with HEPN domain